MEASANNNVSTYLKVPNDLQRQKNTVSRECRICTAPARYSFYGAIVCHSCKMFFKRNAEREQGILRCRLGNACDINVNNRYMCSSCRRAKCFRIGMRVEMIRASRGKKNKRNIEKRTPITSPFGESTTLQARDNKQSLELIPASSLLKSNRSALNIEQRNLISNLIHCFDENSGFEFVEQFIKEQNQLPIKLRFKCSSVNEFFTLMKRNIQLVFEKNRDFLLLSQNDRYALLKRTVEYTTGIGGMFTLRQYHLFDHVSFYKSAEATFTPPAALLTRRVIDLLDPDNTLIKLIIATVAFSTINYTEFRNNDQMSVENSKSLLAIQDLYTELIWRYLVYTYGHCEAVVRFSNLLRCLIYVIGAIAVAHESEKFKDMINSIVKQTEEVLCL